MRAHYDRTHYDEASQERWASETRKGSARTAFERDRARVVHCSALRRLSGKTQVVGPGYDDFARNRLTHSLEVAQVGRELAVTLGCDPEVVDTACLSHDLGHPPFGHNGETALAEVMVDHGGFEGNAQSLRLLTRLETKVLHPDGSSAGLNLTRASLDATMKYPWARRERPGPKFGFYDDDRPVVQWIRAGQSGQRKCLEAQVMDISDDIAYSVHDVEDAIVGGWLDPSHLDSSEVAERVVAQVRDWYLPGIDPAELHTALARLRSRSWFVAHYDGSRADRSALKNMTSELIGRFCRDAATATQLAHGNEPLGRYQGDLIVPDETVAEIATLKGLAAVYVMTPVDRQDEYVAQRELLTLLVTRLRDGDGASLDPLFAADYLEADSETGRLRAVVDQVACLTDASARAWAAKLQ